jgi:limonene-1,2-epoxide hydrolase
MAAVRADERTEAALVEILESFCAAFAARDAGAAMRLFSPDSDIVMVTSEESLLPGPEEVRAFLQRYARGTATYSWAWDRCDVSAAGVWGGSWRRAPRPRRRRAFKNSTCIA